MEALEGEYGLIIIYCTLMVAAIGIGFGLLWAIFELVDPMVGGGPSDGGRGVCPVGTPLAARQFC